MGMTSPVMIYIRMGASKGEHPIRGSIRSRPKREQTLPTRGLHRSAPREQHRARATSFLRAFALPPTTFVRRRIYLPSHVTAASRSTCARAPRRRSVGHVAGGGTAADDGRRSGSASFLPSFVESRGTRSTKGAPTGRAASNAKPRRCERPRSASDRRTSRGLRRRSNGERWGGGVADREFRVPRPRGRARPISTIVAVGPISKNS